MKCFAFEEVKNSKQRVNYVFNTPRDYNVVAATDPVEPFQQVYGVNCGKNDFDRIVGGGLTVSEIQMVLANFEIFE